MQVSFVASRIFLSYFFNALIKEGSDFRRIVDAFRDKKGKEYGVHQNCYNVAYKLYDAIQKKGELIVYDAYSEEGTFVAGLILTSFKNQMVALFLGSTPDSYKVYANHPLFDYAIEKAAETKEVFDFEGSNTESLAFVYHGFGGKTIPYPEVAIYNIPKFIVKGIFMLKNLLRKRN